jgi:hypothetical protein
MVKSPRRYTSEVYRLGDFTVLETGVNSSLQVAGGTIGTQADADRDALATGHGQGDRQDLSGRACHWPWLADLGTISHICTPGYLNGLGIFLP